MALDALGLGLGMTGAPREHTSLISGAIAQKGRQDNANNDLYQSYLKSVTTDNNKYHRMVRPHVNEVTQDFIKKLVESKANNPRGWMKEAPLLIQDLKSQLGDLSDKSNQYSSFENTYNNPNLKLYRPAEVEKVARIMSGVNDYRKLAGVLRSQGIESTDNLAYDDNGSLVTKTSPLYDFTKNAQDFRRTNANVHASIISANDKYRTQGKTSSIFTTRDELNKFAASNNISPEVAANVKTLEDNFNAIMINPDAAYQLSDMYTKQTGTPPQTDKEIFNFYKEMVSPQIGSTFSESISSQPSQTNVTVTPPDPANIFTQPNDFAIGNSTVKGFYLPKGFEFKITKDNAPVGMLNADLSEITTDQLKEIKNSIINPKGEDAEITQIIHHNGKNYSLVKFPKPLGGTVEVFMPINATSSVLSSKLSSKADKAYMSELMKNTAIGSGKKTIDGF